MFLGRQNQDPGLANWLRNFQVEDVSGVDIDVDLKRRLALWR